MILYPVIYPLSNTDRGYVMANAATKVRNAFLQHSQDMTLADLKEFIQDLKSNEISMALSYLLRQRYLSRESIPNDSPKQRKRVWLYKYYPTPLPKQESK